MRRFQVSQPRGSVAKSKPISVHRVPALWLRGIDCGKKCQSRLVLTRRDQLQKPACSGQTVSEIRALSFDFAEPQVKVRRGRTGLSPPRAKPGGGPGDCGVLGAGRAGEGKTKLGGKYWGREGLGLMGELWPSCTCAARCPGLRLVVSRPGGAGEGVEGDGERGSKVRCPVSILNCAQLTSLRRCSKMSAAHIADSATRLPAPLLGGGLLKPIPPLRASDSMPGLQRPGIRMTVRGSEPGNLRSSA
eukprot:3904704-Rhodomonas_salina.2